MFGIFQIPSRMREHLTPKPVELIQIALKNSSKRGGIVLDCFGGSGSTLIACEITKRRCRMMELGTNLWGCHNKRWEQFTGQKAKKIN